MSSRIDFKNRVQEGQQTNPDESFGHTATWPYEFVKIYYNNYLASQENEGCIRILDSEVVIKVQDSNKDIEKKYNIHICT